MPIKPLCKRTTYCFLYGIFDISRCDERCTEYITRIMQTYQTTDNEWLRKEIRKELGL